jgi:hypothetical protein
MNLVNAIMCQLEADSSPPSTFEINNKKKIKLSRYMSWRRTGGEEV